MATFYEITTPDEDRDAYTGDGPPPGFVPALLALLGAAIVILIPYVVAAVTPAELAPGDPLRAVADLRPWVHGDPLPFHDHFSLQGTGPAVAEAGAVAERSGADGKASAATKLAEATESAVDDLPGLEIAPTPQPAGDPPPTAADPVPAGDTAAPAAPPAPVDPITRIAIPKAAWQGVTIEVEDPHGAMQPFYKALARTALKDPGATTRITHWGDSAIAADGMTSVTRRLLQKVFGDGGHGFSLVASGNDWYKRKDVVYQQRGWRAQQFIRKQATDGRYGFGGVGALGYLGARASWATVDDGPVGTAADRFHVYYAKARGGGTLEVSVDGSVVKSLDLNAPETQDAVETLQVTDAAHTFQIRNAGGGATRVYGVALERSAPGVVYDSLGIIGARAARLLNIDADHYDAQLKARAPDLMILMYGGNALPDSTPMETYQQKFGQVLKRFRAARPEASCLVMSPLDHGERHRGSLRTVPRMYPLMDAQRQAALDNGCAWWSLFDAMGGEGSIGTWYTSTPKLASADLAHPTAGGAKILGTLWFKALMKGFNDFVEARKAQAAPQ